ncbi:MAG: HAD-IIB family hydrolase [Muribaculaceae bacterium]|nr:HAD-IIB family hydrolase [Muribaculaceae bacterium]
MEKTLYVSDLDGTLLGADSLISSRSASLLNEAIRRGALFTIATARTPATVARLLQDVQMRMDAIVMTGAARWNPATGIYSHVKYFPPRLARRMTELLRRHRYPAFIYTLRDNLIHIYRVGPMSEQERIFIAEREHTPYKKVMFDTSESGDVWAQPEPDMEHVVLFYSLQPVEMMEAFHPVVTSELPELNALHYCDHDLRDAALGTMEIFAPDATKAAAVKELAAEIKAEATVVFGDNVNDLSMMSVATRALAPQNAIEPVKRMAHGIIGPNTADSVAEYIYSHTADDDPAQDI